MSASSRHLGRVLLAIALSAVSFVVVTPWADASSSSVSWVSTVSPTPADASSPDTTSTTNSVSCPVAGWCVAVGTDTTSTVGGGGVIDTLNSGTWSAADAAIPTDGQHLSLSAVSCAAQGSCVAVGNDTLANTSHLPVVETLSTGTWSVAELALPAPWSATGNSVNLSAVDCPDANDCVALGTIFGGNPASSAALVATQVAGTWTVTVAPLPTSDTTAIATWNALACPSVGTCYAVGQLGTHCTDGSCAQNLPFIDSLASGTWSTTSIALPTDASTNPPFANLFSVSCSSAQSCVAVGGYSPTTTLFAGLVATLSSGTWSSASVSQPPSTTYSTLYSVSCPSDGNCVAVGTYGVPNGGSSTYYGALEETLASNTWTTSTLPAASLTKNELTNVVCVTSTSCVAAGYAYSSGTVSRVLTETLSATSWTPDVLSVSSSSLHETASSLSCPDITSCVVAGTASNPVANPVTKFGFLDTMNANAASTALSLSSSLSTPAVGQSVTLSATVSSSDGSGTVLFTSNNNAIAGCSAVALSAQNSIEVASCTTTALALGTNNVAAYYFGDASVAGSTDALVETVYAHAQSISFTTTPPLNAYVGQSIYNVAATGGASGNPVVFTSATLSICTISTAAVSFLAAGTCIIDADQTSSSLYAPAPTATQNVTVVLPGAQGITFTSSAPKNAAVGGANYTVTASGGASGNPVTFSSLTAKVCALNSAVVSFLGAGTCTIAANQAAGLGYSAATQVTQDVSVAGGATKITITKTSTLAYGSEQLSPVAVNVSAGTLSAAGSLSIYFGSSSLCTTALDNAGDGSCVLSAIKLKPATYSVTAKFTPANGNFLSSNSAAFKLTVAAGATTLQVAPVSAKTTSKTWSVNLSATLRLSASNARIGGQNVVLTLKGHKNYVCTAVSSWTGPTSCTVKGTGAFSKVGASHFSATFTATSLYLASSATSTVKG